MDVSQCRVTKAQAVTKSRSSYCDKFLIFAIKSHILIAKTASLSYVALTPDFMLVTPTVSQGVMLPCNACKAS